MGTLSIANADRPIRLGPARPYAPGSERQADFASILGIENRLASRADATPEQEARSIAENFVAKVFIEPMLALVRESNDQPPPFGPGPGEKQFASLMDAQRSIDLVRAAEWPIVERLTNDLTRTPDRPAVPAASPLRALPVTPIRLDAGA